MLNFNLNFTLLANWLLSYAWCIWSIFDLIPIKLCKYVISLDSRSIFVNQIGSYNISSDYSARMKASNCIIKWNNWCEWSNPIEGISMFHCLKLLVFNFTFQTLNFTTHWSSIFLIFWAFSISLWIRHPKAVLQLPCYSLGIIKYFLGDHGGCQRMYLWWLQEDGPLDYDIVIIDIPGWILLGWLWR